MALQGCAQGSESARAAKPCSEMIRQICDGRGSFVGATKQFAELRDVVLWSSFSLSPFGYPHLSSRLLRHFSLVQQTTSGCLGFGTLSGYGH